MLLDSQPIVYKTLSFFVKKPNFHLFSINIRKHTYRLMAIVQSLKKQLYGTP